MESRLKQIISAVILLLSTGLVIYGQQTDEPRGLPPNQTLKREMTGAETHRYGFALEDDEFFQVRVEQKGIDVMLKLSDAEGKILATMDSPNSTAGPETLSFIAGKAGNFVLEISGFDAEAAKGIYTIKREPPRPATVADRRRVDVERLFVEGMTARDTAGQSDAAITKLEEALAGWRELRDEYLVELTSEQVKQLKKTKADEIFDEAFGEFLVRTVESYEVALTKFQEASRLYDEINDKSENAGTSLVLSGTVAERLGEKSASLNFYTKALNFFRGSQDKKSEANTLTYIGSVYVDLGEKRQALEYYNQALSLRREIVDEFGEASTLDDIGRVYSSSGERQKALEYFNQALPLWRQVGAKEGEATTLTNIGLVYDSLGEKQKALEYYNQALLCYRRVGDKYSEATTLNKIGLNYSSLGDKQKALQYFNQALRLFRELGDEQGESMTLNNISSVHDD